jgi:hypothetical protein
VKQVRDQPWTLGLVEAIAAVDIITRQKLDTRNRIALILLDSNFEIALKEFIVHRADLFPKRDHDDARIRTLFGSRQAVIDAVSARVPEIKLYLPRASHYYQMRNKLIHERATVDISSHDVANYRQTIESILGLLFKLKFNRAS